MTEHNDAMGNDIDVSVKNPIGSKDELEKKSGEKPSGENNAETPWDSLRLQKEKEHVRKIKEEVDNIVARRSLRKRPAASFVSNSNRYNSLSSSK